MLLQRKLRNVSDYTKRELEDAKSALTSALEKCEKIDNGKKLGKSQQTLLDRRIKAIRLALELIGKEMQTR
jgi:hypothetical protein